MKIIIISAFYAGKKILEYLVKKNINPKLVITLPKKEAENRSGYVDMGDFCKEKKIPFKEVLDLNSVSSIKKLKEINPDLILSLGWPRILKKEFLDIPIWGCVGTHVSPLPKYRGSASVNWAIINDEKEWAVTIFKLEEGLDDGDIYYQKPMKISYTDTVKTINDKAIELIKPCLLELILKLDNKEEITLKKQDESKATFTNRRKPEDGQIDWNKSSYEIYNWVRALTKPYPGAFTYYNSAKIIIWKVAEMKEELPTNCDNGTIVDIENDQIIVKSGKGLVKIIDYEKENEKVFKKGEIFL